MKHAHPHQELHDALSGRLTPEVRARLDAHRASCLDCEAAFARLAWAKRQLDRLPAVGVPEGLEERVRSALEGAERTPAPWRRAAVWLGLAAGLVAVLWLFPRGTAVSPAAAARDHRELRTGRLALALETTDIRRMEGYFHEQGLDFETRVFDLGMMGYHLRGGRRHRFAGRPAALFVYEGPDGARLLCEMYPGRTAELPPASELREHDGIRFHVFSEDGLTLVFWQEGDVVCVLVGSGSRETVIQLAFSKAIKL